MAAGEKQIATLKEQHELDMDLLREENSKLAASLEKANADLKKSEKALEKANKSLRDKASS